jgi:2'-hydroxyisoflavone reductase
VQFIDARDVGTWMVDLCEQRRTGTFNATRPGVPWGELLDTCQRVVGGEARIVWLPDEFLRQHEVGEWMELPLWIADPQWRGMHEADVSRAVAAGLTFRPLDETVRGAFERAKTTADAGLTPEREAGVLQAWRLRQRQGRLHGRGGSARSTSSG